MNKTMTTHIVLSPGQNSNQAPSEALFLEPGFLICGPDFQSENGRSVCYAGLSNECKTQRKLSSIRQHVTSENLITS